MRIRTIYIREQKLELLPRLGSRRNRDRPEIISDGVAVQRVREHGVRPDLRVVPRERGRPDVPVALVVLDAGVTQRERRREEH